MTLTLALTLTNIINSYIITYLLKLLLIRILKEPYYLLTKVYYKHLCKVLLDRVATEQTIVPIGVFIASKSTNSANICNMFLFQPSLPD